MTICDFWIDSKLIANLRMPSMSFNDMSSIKPLYSIYIFPSTVELRTIEDGSYGDSRLVCSQSSYQHALAFASSLASNKGILFRNFVTSERPIETMDYL